MVLYPLDEILLSVLVDLLCRGEDFDEIEDICTELVDWLRRFTPFKHGIAPSQTLKRALARLDPQSLEKAFSAWSADLTGRVRGVVAIDGKTVRSSKQDATGKGALHLVSAYAHEAGLMLAQCAVDGKSNEITAIPELLDMLAFKGAVVTIDAIGTQKASAGKIVDKKADYVLALKENQKRWNRTQPCSSMTRPSPPTVHIMRKRASVTDVLRNGLSVPSDPARLVAAVRAHWSVENNLHWTLDVAFRKDEYRTRKDHAA